MRNRFFKCIKNYKNLEKGQIIVDSFYWSYRNVILGTADTKTKVITDNKEVKYIELTNEEYFEVVTFSELRKLTPHFHKLLRIDYNILFNEFFLNELPRYCCRSCGQKLEDEFYHEISIKKLNENKGSLVTCYKCGEEKVMVFSNSNFSLNIFNPDLFKRLTQLDIK